MNQEQGNQSEFMLGDFNPSVAPQFVKFYDVKFYEMNEDGTTSNGTTLEEMLRVSIERLQMLNAKFPCRENSIAITNMEQALMWLNKRTEDRIKRGVEGKHQA